MPANSFALWSPHACCVAPSNKVLNVHRVDPRYIFLARACNFRPVSPSSMPPRVRRPPCPSEFDADWRLQSNSDGMPDSFRRHARRLRVRVQAFARGVRAIQHIGLHIKVRSFSPEGEVYWSQKGPGACSSFFRLFLQAFSYFFFLLSSSSFFF